jgi:DNA gyrase/topoisomerase IV subunit B
MHIRLLQTTFFLQFYPDLVKNGHVYVLETPLFRVRTMPGKNKDEINARKMETTLFITEGDSASGSITKSRNVETQAVFSLRGKPLNSF